MERKEYVRKGNYDIIFYRDPEKTVQHRERGLPAWEEFSGGKSYWENNVRHKLDGLSGDHSRGKYHCLNGKLLFNKRRKNGLNHEY